MSGAPPTNHQIGFITQQPMNSSHNLPYPPSNNLPYPSANTIPYPQPSNPMPYPPPDPQVQTVQPTANTVIIQQPPELGPDPIACHCPTCGEFITTKVDYKTGTRTHLTAAICCLMDNDCCCVLLPYCCNCTKDAHHYCPKCEHYFGKHEPGGC